MVILIARYPNLTEQYWRPEGGWTVTRIEAGEWPSKEAILSTALVVREQTSPIIRVVIQDLGTGEQHTVPVLD